MRKLNFLLLAIFLTTSTFCFADELGPPRHHSFHDFSKGQDSHVSLYDIPANAGAVCQNVRINVENKNLVKRPKMILVFDAGAASVNGLYRYYKTDDTVYTVAAVADTLEWNDAGTAVTIKDGLSTGERWEFVTYQDNMMGFNGADTPIKWDGATDYTDDTDGHRTEDNLCAEIGAPFAELNAGTDLDQGAWYQYKIAFYDGSNYHYNNARSNAIYTGAATNSNVTLTDIPLGPSGTTNRYIYRTEGNSSKANVEADTSFYLDLAFSDNSTVASDDTVTDAVLATDGAPTWTTVSAGTNSDAPPGKYPLVHQERLFVAGFEASPSEVAWSDPYNPDYFDIIDVEKIRDDDGDEITFLKTLLGVLRIGKNKTIQNFYTDKSSDLSWYSSNPKSWVGCSAPYSAEVTPLGIFYYSRKGLYRFDGQNSSLVSDAITPEMNDVSQTSLADMDGHYFKNEYQLTYTSKESGEAINNRVAVYDMIRDAYVIDYKNINCFASLDSGDDSGVLYSGSSDTDGYVYAHEGLVPSLKIRYKSEIDDGTFDDARSYGIEDFPTIELAWDCTIDGWLTELQTKNASIDTINEIITYLPDAIIDRPDIDGSWMSPVYDLSAGAFDKIYWREDLGAYGDITLHVRASDSSVGCAAETWSTGVSDPSGSDISGVTAYQYVQVIASMSTVDIDYTPTMTTEAGYLIKMVYSETGATEESDFLSVWDSGWKDFGRTGYSEDLDKIKVFYQGDIGDLVVRYYNEEGDVDDTFTIDMSILPEDAVGDSYTGVGESKVYTYFPPLNEFGDAPIAQYWRFVVTNDGVEPFTLEQIEIQHIPEPLVEWEG